MKKLLAILLSLVVVFGCEDKKEKKDEPPEAGQMMDGGMDGGQEDMGLEAGVEEDQGGEDAGAEESDMGGDQDVSDGGSEAGQEVDCEDCPDEEPCDC